MLDSSLYGFLDNDCEWTDIFLPSDHHQRLRVFDTELLVVGNAIRGCHRND